MTGTRVRTLIIRWVKDPNPTTLCYGCAVQPEQASLLPCSQLWRSVRWKAGLEGASASRRPNRTDQKPLPIFDNDLPTLIEPSLPANTRR